MIDERNRIDPHKIDLMGRMGRAYYVRASGAAIHTIVQSVVEIGIGFDHLPESIRTSAVLTGNNLGQLAAVTELPTKKAVLQLLEEDEKVKELVEDGNIRISLHEYAKQLLDEKDDRAYAIKLALLPDYL